MSVFYCEECGSYKDGDYDPCVENKKDPCATICEECANNLDGDPDISESMARFRADTKK